MHTGKKRHQGFGELKEGSSSRKKTKWSRQEKDAVQRHLQDFMSVSSALPGKTVISRCLQAEPILKNRNWRNVKDFIRNQHVAKARATEQFL